MGDKQAKRNVELMSRAILDAAKRARERAAAALAAGQISKSEFDEFVKQLDAQADARSKWWITGEGPCP